MRFSALFSVILPVALALGGAAYAQDIFITSGNTSTILRYNSAGTLLGTFANNASGLRSPEKILISPLNGDIYVASFGNSQVMRYNRTTGAVTQIITEGVPGPIGLAFAPDDTLIVGNAGGTITRYNGTTGAQIGGTFASITGTPTDLFYNNSAGEILVTNFDPGGVLRLNAASGAQIGTYATLSSPSAIALGPNGNLYVASFGDSLINRYNASTGALQGTFSGGSLNGPTALAFAANGNLLVANSGGNNIVSITPTGTQSIFASGISNPTGIVIVAPIPEAGSAALIGATLPLLGGVTILRRRRNR